MNARIVASAFWRRLDEPGHDACRLLQAGDRWILEGAAVFRSDGAPSSLNYRVGYHPDWRAYEGRVRGFVGQREVAMVLARDGGGPWKLNGAPVSADAADLPDLDFGFTPATNLPQLRRLALAAGKAADASAAWVDPAAVNVQRLDQRYERRTDLTYWYEAPRFGYAALLELAPDGFVRRYPGLWEAESHSQA